MKRWLLSAVSLARALPWAAPLAAVPQTVGGIEVTVPDNLEARVSRGYQALRVRLRNPGAREARVTLSFPATHQENVYWDRLESTSRTYTIAPQTTLESSFTIPGVPVSGTGLLVVTPREKAILDILIPTSAHAYSSNPSFRVVASRSLSKEALENALQPRELEGPPDPSRGSVVTVGSTLVPLPSTVPGGSPVPLPALFPIERWEDDTAVWPTEWIAYSSIDAVILGASDAARLRPETREALLAFVEAGGVLVVFGSFETPRGWSSLSGPSGSALRAFRAGFGRAFLVEASAPSDLAPFVLEPVSEAIVKTARTLDGERVSASASWAELPQLPARALFVVLLVIMVAIGPLNLAVLSRKKKSMLVYVTVPAIALLSSLSLMGYALANEGIARSVTRSLLTLLDETEQRAVTIGWTGYYTTFTPGGGLLLSPLTELGTVREPWMGRRARRLSVDFTEGQRFLSGFVEARVPARFSVRHVESRRERLVFATEGNARVVTNGLGVDLGELWVTDPDGTLWGVPSVPAGKKATLGEVRSAASAVRAADAIDLRDVFAGSWEALEGRMASVGPQLPPNTWLARVARSPFLADGIDARTRKESSFVLGTSPSSSFAPVSPGGSR